MTHTKTRQSQAAEEMHWARAYFSRNLMVRMSNIDPQRSGPGRSANRRTGVACYGWGLPRYARQQKLAEAPE